MIRLRWGENQGVTAKGYASLLSGMSPGWISVDIPAKLSCIVDLTDLDISVQITLHSKLCYPQQSALFGTVDFILELNRHKRGNLDNELIVPYRRYRPRALSSSLMEECELDRR